MINNIDPQGMDDRQLVAGLKAAVARSRGCIADVLVHLAEVDERRLYREAARSTMFEYCMKDLHLSEGATKKRLMAARASRRFPSIIERVRRGELHLAAVCLLSPHLTAENHERVLKRATHMSKRQVEVLVAELAPKPDVRTSIRRLPVVTSQAKEGELFRSKPSSSSEVSAEPGPEAPPPPKPAVVKPLAPSRYKVTFTADEALKGKLDRARELLGHWGGKDVAAVLDRALGLLVADLEKKKLGKC